MALVNAAIILIVYLMYEMWSYRTHIWLLLPYSSELDVTVLLQLYLYAVSSRPVCQNIVSVLYM